MESKHIPLQESELIQALSAISKGVNDINERLDGIEDRLGNVEQGKVERAKVDYEWDPETFLYPDEDIETTDGAIVMARRRLAQERATEGSINPETGEDRRVITIQLPNGIGTEFPAPSEEALDTFRKQAARIVENRPESWGLSDEAAEDAYAKGGPLWLSAFDHDFLMSLPYDWRVAMAQQVSSYSVPDGSDLARDILRQDAGASRDFGMQMLEVEASE